jgi:hypothetical protein
MILLFAWAGRAETAFRRESPAERLAFPPESSTLMYGMYYPSSHLAMIRIMLRRAAANLSP